MVLDDKAKEFLLRNIKLAVDNLQSEKFDGLRKLVTRMLSVSEIFPDDIWTKELKLASLAFAVIGASTESEFSKIKKEDKDRIIKEYSEKLNELYVAIEEEKTEKVDSFLKDFSEIFFKEIGL